jgi:hypothetical protein
MALNMGRIAALNILGEAFEHEKKSFASENNRENYKKNLETSSLKFCSNLGKSLILEWYLRYFFF